MPIAWDVLGEIAPGDYTVRTTPEIVASQDDAWAGFDDARARVDTALQWWQRDVEEHGLGELNFPPDYPKMPGEPPRVQPSRARKVDDA